LRCLQLLQTDHVRLSLSKPLEQVRQTPVYVVDVEGCDLHIAAPTPEACSSCDSSLNTDRSGSGSRWPECGDAYDRTPSSQSTMMIGIGIPISQSSPPLNMRTLRSVHRPNVGGGHRLLHLRGC
jgi:predicted RNA-binding Zn-ribbon protein involved in translation (DUF1610 family)